MYSTKLKIVLKWAICENSLLLFVVNPTVCSPLPHTYNYGHYSHKNTSITTTAFTQTVVVMIIIVSVSKRLDFDDFGLKTVKKPHET